jgi:hypothetical protein
MHSAISINVQPSSWEKRGWSCNEDCSNRKCSFEWFTYFSEPKTDGKYLEWVKDHLALDELRLSLEKKPVTDSPRKWSNWSDSKGNHIWTKAR